MNLLLCYFSATGNTAKVAGVIGDAFRQMGVRVEEKDITPQSDRSQVERAVSAYMDSHDRAAALYIHRLSVTRSEPELFLCRGL